jgi:hypothetical protein
MSGPRENLEGLSELSDEERHIERLLAELAPRDSRMNRDRTMFLAGQAAWLSPATEARKKRWVWPVITVCSTAAGLVAGLFVAGPIRPAAQIARQTSEAAPVGPPSMVEHTKARPETDVADAPALLELRIALARRAGDELAWAQSDLWTSRTRPAVDAPATASRAPLTYGAALGRLRADEKDL